MRIANREMYDDDIIDEEYCYDPQWLEFIDDRYPDYYEGILDTMRYGVLPPELYWDYVRWEWSAEQSVWPHRAKWERLWEAKVPKRESVMSSNERRYLRKLPARLEIWRGFSREGAEYGLSWTLERDKAIYFARVGCDSGSPKLARATVNKSDVYALLMDHGFREPRVKEVVLNPTCLHDITIENLPAADRQEIHDAAFGKKRRRSPKHQSSK